MILREKIERDFTEAFKSKNDLKLSVLKMIKSSLKNREIDLKKELNDDEILKLFFSEAKKRKDSINQFEKGGRQDLVDQEKKELEVIEKYLPKQKSKEETREIIYGIIKKEEQQ